MRERWAIQLIQTLSLEELREFGSFLKQRFKKHQSQPQVLFKLLIHKTYKHFDDQELWRKIHGKAPYQDNRMRRHYADLFSLLTEFLKHHLTKEDQEAEELNLLHFYNKRQLPALFANFMGKVEKRLAQKVELAEEDYYFLYKLEIERHTHQTQTLTKIEYQTPHNVLETFDKWWILQRLKLTCIHLSYLQMRSREYQEHFMAVLIPYIKQHPKLFDFPLLQTYLLLYAYFKQEKGMNAKKLITRVEAHKRSFSFEERRHVFELLVNALAPSMNQVDGSLKIALELWEIYKWGIRDKLTYFGSFFKAQHFKNIVTLMLILDQADEAEEFFEQHKDELPESGKDDIINLLLGAIYFKKGDLEKARQIFISQRFNRIEYEISAKFMLIQTDYEITYKSEGKRIQTRSFLPNLTNLMHLIERHKELSKNHQDAFLKRAKHMQTFFKAQTRKKLEVLASELSASQPVSYTLWLLAKIKQRLSE